jgi:hypothetical protein
MSSFLIKKSSFKISQISNKEFCKYSLCPQDYKELPLNSNSKDLKIFINKQYKGVEIGSDSYMKTSKFRFLKTVNISRNYIYNQTNIEFCKPSKATIPIDGSFLIVKDGAGNGLGEVALYKQNKNYNDYISAGLIGISIKKEFKWYIFAFLKSQHFKDFINVNTAQGSTIRHSKLVALKYKIPFPTSKNHKNPELIEKYISLLTQNIIDKEYQIDLRQKKIDELVYQELRNNQKSNFIYSLPKKTDLLSLKRIDTGLYTEKYKEENHLIENYINGFSTISISKFKSGSTPTTRIFNAPNSVLRWVTPTNISNEGFYNPIEKISIPTSHNLKKNCILFINRTSKGKKGEYVGITCFYDISYYGEGQHNQGLYRVEYLSKSEMLFITAFMNSRIMRKICGNISIGSKMKEMKSYDFATLKFPKFDSSLKVKIEELYYNNVDKQEFDLETYLNKEKVRNRDLGIFQLNAEIIEIKQELESMLNKIITEASIKV